MITFRLPMARFQEMLRVVLGADVPDALSNRVLMVCTRPRDGVTEVALEDDEALAIVTALVAAAERDAELRDTAILLAEQAASAAPGHE
ncbi:MAG: hypothetical protein EPO26_13105 [Chloroflexota bacterium]|nr:MAG: hypothetical protein EPO26_13105 [Chloroflexota bacterium]